MYLVVQSSADKYVYLHGWNGHDKQTLKHLVGEWLIDAREHIILSCSRILIMPHNSIMLNSQLRYSVGLRLF